jgi:glutaconate CoA-transferase subunit A
VIRQRQRHFTVIRMTPDLIDDQVIGMGCVDKMKNGTRTQPAKRL